MEFKYWNKIQTLFEEKLSLNENGFIQKEFLIQKETLYMIYERNRGEAIDYINVKFGKIKKECKIQGIQHWIIFPEINHILNESGVKEFSNYLDAWYAIDRSTINYYPNFDYRRDLSGRITLSTPPLIKGNSIIEKNCEEMIMGANEYLQTVIYPAFAKTTSYKQVVEDILEKVPIEKRYQYIGAKYTQPKQIALLGLSSKEDYLKSKDIILDSVRELSENEPDADDRQYYTQLYDVCLNVCSILEKKFQESV